MFKSIYHVVYNNRTLAVLKKIDKTWKIYNLDAQLTLSVQKSNFKLPLLTS